MKVKKLLLMLILPISLTAQDLSWRASWQADLKLRATGIGAIVRSVEENSPLQQAGVKPDDIILQINGHSILSDERWTILFHRPDNSTDSSCPEL
ncbi:MAG: PDZ domain-containing protein [Bacteroidota bacterium]